MALSYEPFLLVITRLSVSARSNDSNTLADRLRAVRPPSLVRCDNAPRGACLTLGEKPTPNYLSIPFLTFVNRYWTNIKSGRQVAKKRQRTIEQLRTLGGKNWSLCSR